MIKLVISILFLILGQTLVWFQLYGTDKISFIKNHKYVFVYLVALPIAFLYITATKNGIAYFGSTWPIRILTFAIGNLVFFGWSYFLLNESLDLKSIVCLSLTLIVIFIQIFWK